MSATADEETAEKHWLEEANGGDAREVWERCSGMAEVVPEIENQLKTNKLTWSAALVLTQGVDDSMARFKELFLNFAVTAALFLAGETALLVSPPDYMHPGPDRNLRKEWVWAYFAFAYAAFTLHCGVVILAVHLSFHLERFQRDADFVKFALKHDLDNVKTWLLIQPLLSGVVLSFVPILIAIASNVTPFTPWLPFAYCAPAAVIIIAGPPYLAKDASGATLDSFSEAGAQSKSSHPSSTSTATEPPSIGNILLLLLRRTLISSKSRPSVVVVVFGVRKNNNAVRSLSSYFRAAAASPFLILEGLEVVAKAEGRFQRKVTI